MQDKTNIIILFFAVSVSIYVISIEQNHDPIVFARLRLVDKNEFDSELTREKHNIFTFEVNKDSIFSSKSI